MGKHSHVMKQMMRRSHSAGAGMNHAHRPKRNVNTVKTYDDTVGLSRTEERELKRALYASLQESKRVARYQPDHYEVPTAPMCRGGVRSSRPIRSRSWPHTPSQPGTPTSIVNISVDDSSQDSTKSSVSSAADLKNKQDRKIHAQRKFAQGSLPPTPSLTPVKVKASPIKLLPKTAKTEDFLTFLCLRGSSVLPPHLDFFKFSRGEPPQGEISAPQTPQSEASSVGDGRTRESTPESSSNSTNDELYEIGSGTPTPRSFALNGRNGASARKAARASASTPETARGIVSLSQGFSKKPTRVSTPRRGRKFGSADKTPSPKKGHHQVTPSKRGQAVKSLSSQLKTPPKKKLCLKQKAMLSFLPRGKAKTAGKKTLLTGNKQVNWCGVEHQSSSSSSALRRSCRLSVQLAITPSSLVASAHLSAGAYRRSQCVSCRSPPASVVSPRGSGGEHGSHNDEVGDGCCSFRKAVHTKLKNVCRSGRENHDGGNLVVNQHFLAKFGGISTTEAEVKQNRNWNSSSPCIRKAGTGERSLKLQKAVDRLWRRMHCKTELGDVRDEYKKLNEYREMEIDDIQGNKPKEDCSGKELLDHSTAGYTMISAKLKEDTSSEGTSIMKTVQKQEVSTGAERHDEDNHVKNHHEDNSFINTHNEDSLVENHHEVIFMNSHDEDLHVKNHHEDNMLINKHNEDLHIKNTFACTHVESYYEDQNVTEVSLTDVDGSEYRVTVILPKQDVDQEVDMNNNVFRDVSSDSKSIAPNHTKTWSCLEADIAMKPGNPNTPASEVPTDIATKDRNFNAKAFDKVLSTDEAMAGSRYIPALHKVSTDTTLEAGNPNTPASDAPTDKAMAPPGLDPELNVLIEDLLNEYENCLENRSKAGWTTGDGGYGMFDEYIKNLPKECVIEKSTANRLWTEDTENVNIQMGIGYFDKCETNAAPMKNAGQSCEAILDQYGIGCPEDVYFNEISENLLQTPQSDGLNELHWSGIQDEEVDASCDNAKLCGEEDNDLIFMGIDCSAQLGTSTRISSCMCLPFKGSNCPCKLHVNHQRNCALPTPCTVSREQTRKIGADTDISDADFIFKKPVGTKVPKTCAKPVRKTSVTCTRCCQGGGFLHTVVPTISVDYLQNDVSLEEGRPPPRNDVNRGESHSSDVIIEGRDTPKRYVILEDYHPENEGHPPENYVIIENSHPTKNDASIEESHPNNDASIEEDQSPEYYICSKAGHPTKNDANVEAGHPTKIDACMEASHPTKNDASVEAGHPTMIDASVEAGHPTKIDARIKAGHPTKIDARIKAGHPPKNDANVEAGHPTKIDACMEASHPTMIDASVEAGHPPKNDASVEESHPTKIDATMTAGHPPKNNSNPPGKEATADSVHFESCSEPAGGNPVESCSRSKNGVAPCPQADKPCYQESVDGHRLSVDQKLQLVELSKVVVRLRESRRSAKLDRMPDGISRQAYQNSIRSDSKNLSQGSTMVNKKIKNSSSLMVFVNCVHEFMSKREVKTGNENNYIVNQYQQFEDLVENSKTDECCSKTDKWPKSSMHFGTSSTGEITLMEDMKLLDQKTRTEETCRLDVRRIGKKAKLLRSVEHNGTQDKSIGGTGDRIKLLDQIFGRTNVSEFKEADEPSRSSERTGNRGNVTRNVEQIQAEDKSIDDIGKKHGCTSDIGCQTLEQDRVSAMYSSMIRINSRQIPLNHGGPEGFTTGSDDSVKLRDSYLGSGKASRCRTERTAGQNVGNDENVTDAENTLRNTMETNCHDSDAGVISTACQTEEGERVEAIYRSMIKQPVLGNREPRSTPVTPSDEIFRNMVSGHELDTNRWCGTNCPYPVGGKPLPNGNMKEGTTNENVHLTRCVPIMATGTIDASLPRSLSSSWMNTSCTKEVDTFLASVGHQQTSVGHQQASFEHQQTSVGDQQASVAHQQASVAHQQTSVEHQQTSVGDQQASVEHQQASVEHQQASVEHQQTSVEHQQASVEHQQASVAHQQASVGDQQASVAHQQASVGHQQALVEHQQASVGDQQASVGHQIVSHSLRAQSGIVPLPAPPLSIQRSVLLPRPTGQYLLGSSGSAHIIANQYTGRGSLQLFPPPPSIMSCGICESSTFKPVASENPRGRPVGSKGQSKKDLSVRDKLKKKFLQKKSMLKGKLKDKLKGKARLKGSAEEHPRKKRTMRRSSSRLKELSKVLLQAKKSSRRKRTIVVEPQPEEEEEEEEEEIEEVDTGEEEVTLPPPRKVGKKRNFAPRPIGGLVAEMPRAVSEEFDNQRTDDDTDDEVSFANVSPIREAPSMKVAKAKRSAKKRKVKMTTRSASQKVVASAKKVAKKRLSAVKNAGSAKGDQLKLSRIIEKRRRLKEEAGKSDSAKRGRKSGGMKKLSSPEKSRSDNMLKFGVDGLTHVPTFRPSEEEFRDPIQYIDSLREQAEPYGMCQIIPPHSWKCESKINEEMRFTAQVQLVHKLYKRWGPNMQFTTSVNKHLDAIGADLEPSPQIGGVEVDLHKLSRTIQEFGGMQNVVDKKKWVKIADAMKIPKLAQDRGMRLYDVYCKYLLPYDTLSSEEKSRVQQSVLSEKQKKKSGKNDEEEAIVKGKSNPLSTFNRIARNVRSMWFKEDPTTDHVECEYWKLVEERNHHVAVQCGHISTSTQGSGFPSKKDSPYSRHGWNLNNLSENPKCILRCLGPVSGVTIPTLHIGMLFATSCWCTDVHQLPYIQYLHTGADIVWYSIPKQEENKFKAAMKDLVPSLISEDPRWLKEDTVMVNPYRLAARGVSVSQCVQKPKTFVAIFPKSYMATVSCGYNVSESVHYATKDWLKTGVSVAEDLVKSSEPELFSMDALLCHLVTDTSTDIQTLKTALPLFDKVLSRELSQRQQLFEAGVKCSKNANMTPEPASPPARKRSIDQVDDNVCDVSKKHCFFSKVVNDSESVTLSLEEGLKHVQRKKNLKHCKFFYRHTEEELKAVQHSAQCRLDTSGHSDSGGKKRAIRK